MRIASPTREHGQSRHRHGDADDGDDDDDGGHGLIEDVAVITVAWNTDSIVKAIRQYAI